MSYSLRSQLRDVGVISLLVFPGMVMGCYTRAACYSTPRTAIDAVETTSPFSPVVESGGFRVIKIESDPVLGRSWAMIASCGHPEWPAFAIPTIKKDIPRASHEVASPLVEGVKAVPLVRAGDVVRLWMRENFLRIEVAGISEDSGGLGKTIRVRLSRRNRDDQSTQAEFFGVVRGPSNVEIELR
jgi:hypothetical protein